MRLTEAEGLHNVSFEQADAETHHFPAERFDVAISRFGTMFFGDPVAAFTNIARAMRRLDPASPAHAREHLLQTLAAHAGGDGVWFDSRAWIVKARRGTWVEWPSSY